MSRRFLRLLALIAVVLMPFGMAGAPTMAMPALAAADSHCADHHNPGDEEPPRTSVHCTGCSALPAFDAPVQMAEIVPQAPRLPMRARVIAGIEPELPTPPPKIA